MKKLKYVLAGALMLGMSAPMMAQSDDYKTALGPIISAIEAAPNDPKAGKDLIKSYKKTYKNNEQALVALGNVYLSEKNYTQATAIANSITENKKLNGTYAYMLLGDIAAIQDSVGNAGAAATQYQTAISLDPQNVAAYERYAKVYRRVNAQTAVAKLEELRKVKPDYPVEATAADILIGDGKYGEGLKWYDKANRANLSETNFYNYGYAAYVVDQNDKALDVISSGLQKFAGSEYLSRIGMMAAVAKKDYPLALNYANTMFAGKDKKVANDYLVYAKALAGGQQFDKAMEAVGKAKELDPNNTEVFKTLADVYNLQGNEDKALEAQQQYLAAKKDANSQDYAGLANTYMQKAEKLTDKAQKAAAYNKAIEVYEDMITKFPSISDWIWLQEAYAAYGLNDADKVADLYKKVADFEEAKSSLNAEQKGYLETVYYGLGFYNQKKGNEAVAKEYFQKCLNINPDNADAKKALGM